MNLVLSRIPTAKALFYYYTLTEHKVNSPALRANNRRLYLVYPTRRNLLSPVSSDDHSTGYAELPSTISFSIYIITIAYTILIMVISTTMPYQCNHCTTYPANNNFTCLRPAAIISKSRPC